jgi:hypothetical protein
VLQKFNLWMDRQIKDSPCAGLCVFPEGELTLPPTPHKAAAMTAVLLLLHNSHTFGPRTAHSCKRTMQMVASEAYASPVASAHGVVLPAPQATPPLLLHADLHSVRTPRHMDFRTQPRCGAKLAFPTNPAGLTGTDLGGSCTLYISFHTLHATGLTGCTCYAACSFPHCTK